MEEIGLQLACPQEKVIDAVRRYVSEGGRRLIEECPLRPELTLLRARGTPAELEETPRPTPRTADDERRPTLAGLIESYFDYFFRYQRRRALLVGPTVGGWTGVLWDEKAIDCRLLRALTAALNCRGVGYCFVEEEEYTYVEMAGGEDVQLFSSFLAEDDGRSFWSARNSRAPEEGLWVAGGFLKNRYRFIHGFYDLPFLRGEKATFSCYQYSGFPDRYDETRNHPLSAFRYFYFHAGTVKPRTPAP